MIPFNRFQSQKFGITWRRFKPFQLICAFLCLSVVLGFVWVGQLPAFAQQEAAITVDFAAKQQGLSSMSGFLYGVGANKPPDNMIKPLQPNLWRSSSLNLYPRITQLGSQFQLLVSDTWGYGRQRGWPYQNYQAWEDHLQKIAQQHKGKALTWDVWNEPDLRDPFWKGSRKQFFETYKRAYRILRQELGPNALIGGPSIAKYNKGFLKDFLDYCKSNNLEVNFISWHELNDQAITNISAHVNEVRRSFVENSAYRSLKIQKIYINEIVGPTAQYRPAEILGYLYYTEQSGIDGAVKACWEPQGGGRNNCFNESLDGLVTPQGSAPRAAWWVYKAYADGFNSRVSSRSNNPRIVALASQSNPQGKAQILMGYFEQGAASSIATVVLTLKNLQRLSGANSGEPLTFTIERIPNSGEQVIKELVKLRQEQIAVGNQVVRLTIPNLKLHEAYLLTIG